MRAFVVWGWLGLLAGEPEELALGCQGPEPPYVELTGGDHQEPDDPRDHVLLFCWLTVSQDPSDPAFCEPATV